MGVIGRGPTHAEAFVQTALGVFALIVEPGSVEERESREVRAHGESLEALLVAWINECLYVHEVEGFVARRVALEVFDTTPRAGGEPLRLHSIPPWRGGGSWAPPIGDRGQGRDLPSGVRAGDRRRLRGALGCRCVSYENETGEETSVSRLPHREPLSHGPEVKGLGCHINILSGVMALWHPSCWFPDPAMDYQSTVTQVGHDRGPWPAFGRDRPGHVAPAGSDTGDPPPRSRRHPDPRERRPCRGRALRHHGRRLRSEGAHHRAPHGGGRRARSRQSPRGRLRRRAARDSTAAPRNSSSCSRARAASPFPRGGIRSASSRRFASRTGPAGSRSCPPTPSA